MAAGDDYYEDLLKIVLQYEGERNTAENVLYASCLGAHGAALGALDTLAQNIGGKWGTEIMPYVSAAVTLVNCLVADWTSADGLTGEYAFDIAGGLTGDNLTDQVATLVNETTLMRYRGGRGRIYIPQPDVTKIESGTSWTSTFVSDIDTAITAWADFTNEQSIGDDLLTWVLYHRAGSKNLEQGFETIIGADCSSIPGTQRRRVRRVGHLR